MRSLVLASLTLLIVAPSLVAQAQVGQSRQYVVNGRAGTADDLLATVALLDAEGGPLCTGTLIADRIVATAAHCLENRDGTMVAPAELRVLQGSLDVETDFARNLRDSIAVSALAGHCGYFETGGQGRGPEVDESSFGRGDDIGILVLAESIDGVDPVPPLPASRASELVDGEEVVVTGYGVYELDPEQGGLLHTGVTRVERSNEWEIQTIRNAAGEGTDSCFGDSGGPLYWTDGEGDVWLVGITSRGTSDSEHDCGDGGIYARPSGYEQWVMDASAGSAPMCDVQPGNNTGSGEPTTEDADALVEELCAESGPCADGGSLEGHALCRACRSGGGGRCATSPVPAGGPNGFVFFGFALAMILIGRAGRARGMR